MTYAQESQCSLRNAMKKLKDFGITDVKLHSTVYALVFESMRRKSVLTRLLHESSKKGTVSLANPFLRNLTFVAIYRIVFEKIPSPLVQTTILQHLKRLENVNERQYHTIKTVLSTVNSNSFNSLLKNVKDEVERFSLQYYHPTWLTRDLLQWYDQPFIRSLYEANNQPLPRYIRLNTLIPIDDILAELKDEGVKFVRDPLLPDVVKVQETALPLPRLESSKKGYYYLQDRGSAFISHVLDPQPGEVILDACAAPGGKTTHIAALMQNQGTIIATDNRKPRLQELKKKLTQFNIKNVKPVYADVREPLPAAADQIYDRILLDAPCSSSGTFPQRPEVKWRIQRHNLKYMANQQLKMLTNLSRYLKTGGRLTYVTCSIHPIENEFVILNFLKEHKEFKLVDFPLWLGIPSPIKEIGKKGQRLYPHISESEGFSIFVLEKR